MVQDSQRDEDPLSTQEGTTGTPKPCTPNPLQQAAQPKKKMHPASPPFTDGTLLKSLEAWRCYSQALRRPNQHSESWPERSDHLDGTP